MVIRLGYLFESMWQSVKSPFCVLSVCFVCFPPLWQSEVTLLRNEVARLKQLLLAHKDCPVTAMQKKSAYHTSEKEDSCEEMSVPGSPQNEAIQHSSVSTSNGVSSSSMTPAASAPATADQSTEDGQAQRGAALSTIQTQPSGSWSAPPHRRQWPSLTAASVGERNSHSASVWTILSLLIVWFLFLSIFLECNVMVCWKLVKMQKKALYEWFEDWNYCLISTLFSSHLIDLLTVYTCPFCFGPLWTLKL